LIGSSFPKPATSDEARAFSFRECPSPGHKEAMMQEVNQALRDGDIERALGLWRKATAGREDPGTLLGHFSLLAAAHRLGEAPPILEKLLIHPESTPAQLLPAAKTLIWLFVCQRGKSSSF
jgi:hypothetical protein